MLVNACKAANEAETIAAQYVTTPVEMHWSLLWQFNIEE